MPPASRLYAESEFSGHQFFLTLQEVALKENKNVSIPVVTVTWSSVETIEDSLKSLAQQTWSHRKHIVIDGDGCDGTIEVPERHRQQLI